MAYNPVSNPNPENSPSRVPTGVMSQGHYGNIMRSEGIDLDRNICTNSHPPYGEWDEDNGEIE
jgi:hypothetical protein